MHSPSLARRAQAGSLGDSGKRLAAQPGANGEEDSLGVTQLRKRVRSLEAQVLEAQAQADDARGKFHRAVVKGRQLERERDELRSEVSNLRRADSSWHEDVESSSERVGEPRSNAEGLESELAEANRRIGELEVALEETRARESTTEHLEHLDACLSRERERADFAERSLVEEGTRADNAEHACRQLRDQLASSSQYDLRQCSPQEENELHEQLSAERERANAAEERARSVSEAHERADALHREAQELRSQLESQKAEHQAASEEMQRRLAAESERAGAAEQRAQAASVANERVDALQREAQELRSQLESQKAEHQAASEEMQRRLAAESERAGAAEQRAQAASEADERADALQREAQELRSQLESQKAEHQAASEEMQQNLAEERKRADAAEQEAKFASEAQKRANESEREDLEMRADMAERELDNIRQLLDVQNFTEKGDEGERREHKNGTQTQDLCEAVHKLQRRMNEAEHSAEERARAILNQQRRADELAQYLSVAQTELEEERERLAKKCESEQLIAKLQNELAEKEQQVADTQVEISSLAAQLAEQQNRAIGAEEDASNIRKELQSMDERTRAQLQHMEQRALSAESEESEEMARLKHELSSREKEVEELRSENQRLSDQTESMEIRDEQIKSLNASLQESKKKLQKAVQKGKQKESQLKEVMHKRDELQSMLEKEQDEHGRLRAEMAKLSGFNCEQIKGAWTDALDSIAERLKYVQMKNDDSVAEGLHRDNHFSVHDEQQRLEAAEAQIATLKERNEHLENCISSTCDLIGAEGKGDLEEKAWQLNSRVDELDDEWREAFESQRSVHEDLNNQFHKLAQELGTKEEVTAMQQVARECTGAQERLQETQKELQSVQTELEETRQRFRSMDGQLRSVLEVEVGDELIAKAQETQSNMRLWEKEAHNIQRHFENEKKRREHLEQSMQSGVGEQSSRLLEAEEQLKEKQKQVEELRLSVDDERQRRDDFQALLSAEKEQRASLEKRHEEEKSDMSQRIEELLQTVLNREQRLEQLDRNLREARDRFQDEQMKRQSAEQDLARMAAGDEALHLRDENISALESKVEYEKDRCKQTESQHNDAQAENNVCEAYNALLTTVEHASHELRKSVSSLVSTASTGGVVDDTKEASMGNKLEESVSAALETIQFLTERVRQLEQDKAELHEGERDDGNNCNKRAEELEEELQKQANAVNETYQALEMKQLELDSLKGALEDARRCEQELQEFKELLGTDPQEAASQLGAAQDQACHLQSELDSVHAKEAELQELREKYTALESEVTEQRRRAACLSNELTQLRAAQSAQPNPALAQQQVQPQQQRRRRHVGWLGTTQEADEEKGEAAESSASARNMQLSEMEGFRLCPRRIHVALNFTDRNLAKAGESLSNKPGARAAMMAYLSFVHSALIVFATLSYA